MSAAHDPIVLRLSEIVRTDKASARVNETVQRVLHRLNTSSQVMEWEIVPLTVFADRLPETIRSCWVFAIRAHAATGAERHPNSHQRSLSLTGSGRFELRSGSVWEPHPLVTTDDAPIEERWVSIPPSTWHRLVVGSKPWGMVSFHTVTPEHLIEETPVDANDLEGDTRRELYAGRR